MPSKTQAGDAGRGQRHGAEQPDQQETAGLQPVPFRKRGQRLPRPMPLPRGCEDATVLEPFAGHGDGADRCTRSARRRE